jgi:methionine-rich copper-binding protein CopC
MIARVTALAVTGLALATAAPAAAHVGVKAYSPKRGSTASRSLERVAVTFKGRITDGKLTVRGGNGNKVSIGSGSVAPGKRTIRARLRDGLAKGPLSGHVQRAAHRRSRDDQVLELQPELRQR